jgi:raffinose/stachyose/melibiose transport system permease protein
MSLYDWNGLGNAKFIGLMNYVNIFITDKVIGPAALNNVKWALIFITLPIIIALPVASMLRKVKYGQMVYRTFFFLPYVVAAAITGRIFATYYNPIYGIGKLFSALGITSSLRLDLLGNPKLALYAIAFADNWHWWGFVMVLLIAALHQVDAGLYESARVEGANKWQEFIHITIPGIRPTLFFLIMMTIIWSFLQFDYIWVMTKGGPAQSTEIISTWMYKNAFINYKAGYANAICVLQSFVCIFVYLLLKIIQKKGWDV